MRYLLHQLTLLWCEDFAQVKVVFHAVVTCLLFDVTERGKLFLNSGIIPFSGLDHVNQHAVFNVVHRNLADIGFQLLVQLFNLRHLVIAQFQVLYHWIWAGAGTLDTFAASVLKEAPAVVAASKVMRTNFFILIS